MRLAGRRFRVPEAAMHELMVDVPAGRAHAQLLLAHGAGAMMDTPFMSFIAAGLAAQGIRVSRFEFPYMARRRADGVRRGPDPQRVLLQTWRAVIAEAVADLPLFIGGKSMGGRMATLVANEPGVSGVVVLGYPFHPAGKPEQLRSAHLEEMPCPTLIVQGERDSLGRRDEVAGYALADAVALAWLPDGDHSFKPRKQSGHTEADNLQRAVETVANFIGTVVAGR